MRENGRLYDQARKVDGGDRARNIAPRQIGVVDSGKQCVARLRRRRFAGDDQFLAVEAELRPCGVRRRQLAGDARAQFFTRRRRRSGDAVRHERGETERGDGGGARNEFEDRIHASYLASLKRFVTTRE